MEFINFIRQFRIGPFAIFDTLVSYLGIFIATPLLTKLSLIFRLNISRKHWLWLTLPISILIHFNFGIETPLTKMFFDINNYYSVKLIIFFMLFMGLKDILGKKKERINYKAGSNPSLNSGPTASSSQGS